MSESPNTPNSGEITPPEVNGTQEKHDALTALKESAAAEASKTPEDDLAPPSEETGSVALQEALKTTFLIVKVLMVALLAVFFASGFFIVDPQQVAVVFHLGKVRDSEPLKPGFHWAFPYPIDEVIRIPTGQTLTVTSSVGWHRTSPEEEAMGLDPIMGDTLVPGVDGYTLTADENILHVRAQIKYRIEDPIENTFRFVNARQALINIVDNAVVYAAARYTADDAMYVEQTAFKEAIRNRIRDRARKINLGISIEPSDIDIKVPIDVRPAFDAVIAAEQERFKLISEANAYREEIIRRAEGEAQAVLNAGMITSNQTVLEASADAQYFKDQLPFFQSDPELFKKRLLTETAMNIFTNAQDKFFIADREDGKPREVRVMLSREPVTPKAPQPQQPPR
jgi:membrane protease subunit HflK